MKNKVIAALVISIGLISIVGGCSSPSSRLKSMKNDATERLKKETQDSTLEESSFDSEIEANNHNSKPEIIPVSSGNDLFGSLNGVGFKEANNSWSDTFAKDGWVLNTDNDGEYCFATARNNDKYGTDIELYLYNGMSDDNVFVGKTENVHDYTAVIAMIRKTANMAKQAWNDFPDSIPYQNAKGEVKKDIMHFPFEEGKDIKMVADENKKRYIPIEKE